MRIAALLLVLAAGCGGSPPAQAPVDKAPVDKAQVDKASVDKASVDKAPADKASEAAPLCLSTPGLKGLYLPPPSEEPLSAFAKGAADYQRAFAAAQADNHLIAARRFLDCARRYRTVPADHSQRDMATKNAEVCYYNAIQEYGAAGRFQAEGHAALEHDAEKDPLLAGYLRAELVDPPTDNPCAP